MSSQPSLFDPRPAAGADDPLSVAAWRRHLAAREAEHVATFGHAVCVSGPGEPRVFARGIGDAMHPIDCDVCARWFPFLRDLRRRALGAA